MMKTKHWIQFVLFSSLTLYCSGVFADVCSGRWNVVVDNSSRIVDGSSTRIPISIQIESSLRRCFDQGVFIRSRGKDSISVESASDRIEGYISSRSQISNSRPLGRGVIFPINRGARETKLWVNFPNARYATPGYYDSLLQFSVVGRDSIDAKSARVRLLVSPFVSMSVKGSNGAHVVDFGVLRKGDSKNLDLSILSNTAVDLTVKSENGHLQHTDISTSFIPYFMRLNGKNLVFNEVFRMEAQSHRKNARLNIQIGETKGARAGNYLDIVTITATAQP